MPKVFALVPAAGQGTRIGDAVPKQYIPLAGKPMMFHAIEALAAVSRIERVLVVLSPLDRHWGQHDWSALPDKIEATFSGGARRAESVLNTLKLLGDRVAKNDWILVHDAARPCILKELVEQFLDEVGDDPGGGPAGPAARRYAQARRREPARLRNHPAHEPVARTDAADVPLRLAVPRPRENPAATDECEAVESIGYSAPRLVQGESTNIKVTFAEDLQLAEMIIAHRNEIDM